MHLLGAFRLAAAAAPVSQPPAPRLQALLAYLVLHRDAPQSRQQLAFLLWPDTSDAQARTNLRQLLHALRQTLPEADQYVRSDGHTLQWRADAAVRCDVLLFEAALAQAAAEWHGIGEQDTADLRVALEQAIALYQGDLLQS